MTTTTATETFTLTIDLGGAAMSEPADVAAALEKVAERVRRQCQLGMSEWTDPILDENGNTVGTYGVEVPTEPNPRADSTVIAWGDGGSQDAFYERLTGLTVSITTVGEPARDYEILGTDYADEGYGVVVGQQVGDLGNRIPVTTDIPMGAIRRVVIY
jgi:hypothetical protein